MLRVLVCLIPLLIACNFAPSTERPELELPRTWRVSSTEARASSGASWWKGFNDPVLNGYIEEALANNLELSAASARVGQLYSRYGVESSLLFPNIPIEGQLSRTKLTRGNQFGGFIPLRVESVSSIKANTNWEIDLWGSIRNAKNGAMADYLAEVFGRRGLLISLVANVADSYFELASADRELEIARSTLQSREESFRIAEQRFEQGFSSELDLRQSEALVAAARVAIPAISQRIIESENRLALLLGRPSQGLMRGKPLVELKYDQPVPVGLPSEVLLKRPDVQQAEAKLMRASYDVGAARAAFFPRVSLSAFYGYESNYRDTTLFEPDTNAWQLIPTVSLPFLHSVTLIRQLDAQKLAREAEMLSYKQVVLASMAEVENAISNERLSKDESVARTDEVRVLRRYVELARLNYEAGERSYLDLLDAERNLFNSEVLLAQSQANYLKSCVELFKALGGGWVESVEQESGASAVLG